MLVMIIEFEPDQKMEKAFNELGKEGWELVSVTPVGLSIKGDYDFQLSLEDIEDFLETKYDELGLKW